MQPRPEGGLWAAARLVRSEPRHCRWRGAKLRLRAGLQRALGRLSLGLSRGRCLVSQMVVSDREPFPHTAQSTFWSRRGTWASPFVRSGQSSLQSATGSYRVVWRSTPRVLFVPCGERTASLPGTRRARGARAAGLLVPALPGTLRTTTRADGVDATGGLYAPAARGSARAGGAGVDRRRPTTAGARARVRRILDTINMPIKERW